MAEQIDGQLKLFAARLDTHDRQLEQLQRRAEQTAAQTDGIDAQITAMDLQLASVREEASLEQAVIQAQDAGRKYISVASRILNGK